jgi:hypothetical protein
MFMVTERVNPAELEAMKSRLADTDLLLKDMKATNKQHEDNYNTLKRSLNNLMNEFHLVKAKVAAAKLGSDLLSLLTQTRICVAARQGNKKEQGRRREERRRRAQGRKRSFGKWPKTREMTGPR